jgi:hypothetical protein
MVFQKKPFYVLQDKLKPSKAVEISVGEYEKMKRSEFEG